MTSDILELCMSRGSRRLVKGLLARGVALRGAFSNLFIMRDHGQPMMNKAAGEIAPTWRLAADGLFRGHRLVGYSGLDDDLALEFDGKIYGPVESCAPLGWIIRHKPEEWEIGLNPWNEWDDHLWVDVGTIPPHWKK